MMNCEGYKMFTGTATVRPVCAPAFDVTGTWVYKPAYDCWYVTTANGWVTSYPAEIVTGCRELVVA